MNWVPLKKYHIHLIDREVSRILEQHRQMRQSIIDGDILSVQKLSDLQLSIKKRIQEMDEFYNVNCLDERVRFLQGPRMRLWRLLNNSMIIEKDKELTVNFPWKNTNEVSPSRNLNATSRANGGMKKNEPSKDETLKSNSRNEINRSGARENSEKPKQLSIKKKPNITLQIPDDSPYQRDEHSRSNNKRAHNARQRNHGKTGRKTEYIPQKLAMSQANNYSLNPNNAASERKTNKSRVNEKQGQPPGSSRSRVTNSSKSRALTESGNMSSMKKLNDLIFTIKMTKQEYQGFMDMKKNLERQER